MTRKPAARASSRTARTRRELLAALHVSGSVLGVLLAEPGFPSGPPWSLPAVRKWIKSTRTTRTMNATAGRAGPKVTSAWHAARTRRELAKARLAELEYRHRRKRHIAITEVDELLVRRGLAWKSLMRRVERTVAPQLLDQHDIRTVMGILSKANDDAIRTAYARRADFGDLADENEPEPNDPARAAAANAQPREHDPHTETNP